MPGRDVTSATADIAALNTLALSPSVADLTIVSAPDALERRLLAMSPADRLACEVAGELSNTVLGDTVERPLILYRDGAVCDLTRQGDDVRIVCDGSCSWDALVEATCKAGVAGVELLSGIPGTVGAGVVQNIAAYGQRISDAITGARALDRRTGRIVDLTPADFGFTYRTSALKRADTFTSDLVILEVTLTLKAGPPAPITYAELADHHRATGRDDADLMARRASVLEVRGRKGMVWKGPNWVPSAGSFFLSPVVSADQALRITEAVRGSDFADAFLSWYRPDEATTRLPAALALRAAGFMNGDRWGDVGLSPHHILALRTFPGATASDVQALAQVIIAQVRDRLGIDLHAEVRRLGVARDEPTFSWLDSNPLQPGAAEPEWAKALGRPT